MNEGPPDVDWRTARALCAKPADLVPASPGHREPTTSALPPHPATRHRHADTARAWPPAWPRRRRRWRRRRATHARIQGSVQIFSPPPRARARLRHRPRCRCRRPPAPRSSLLPPARRLIALDQVELAAQIAEFVDAVEQAMTGESLDRK